MTAAESLRKAIDEASAAPNRQARRAPLSALIGNKETLGSLGVWMAEDPDVAESLLMEFGGLPGMDGPVGKLRKRMRELADSYLREQRAQSQRQGFRAAGEDEERPTLDLGEGSEHLPPLVIPERYEVTRRGVQEWKKTIDGDELVRLNHRPLLPTKILADIDTRERSLQLEWPGRKGWTSRTIQASTAQDPRAFVKLCDFGAPVAAHNARQLARFLDEVEEHNTAALPRAWATRRMGWMRDGELGFALGNRVIGSDQVQVELDPDGSEAQIADALSPSGSEAEWLEAVRKVSHFPSVMLALYASICAPLLVAIPAAPNAIFGWCGETSTGKTTILRLAASVWGNPDERGVGLVQKWNQTPTYLERVATFCTNLPVLLDDTNDVAEKQRDMIPRMLYQFAGGKGRGRGKPDGTRRTESWRSPMLSTGEASLTSYSQDAGTRARTLVLSGPPFGAGSQGEVVSDLTLACLEHHGHLGPRIVRQLLKARGSWPAIAARYEARCGVYAALVERTATKRLARVVVLLEEAKLLGEACGLPVPTCDPIEFSWQAAQACGAETDRPLAALLAVYGWAVAHQAEFWGRNTYEKDGTVRQPSRGWAGLWQADAGLKPWDCLAFDKACLHRVLAYHGFDPGAVVPLWREREWLLEGKDRLEIQRRVNGAKTRLIAIKRGTLRDAAGIRDEDET